MSRASRSDTLRCFDDLPDLALVDIYVVAALFGMAVPTAWRHSAEGKIPHGRKVGKATRWRVGELRAVLAAAPVKASRS
jgi:predicted DNA-binding transcriptional regulator AlpA